MSNILLTRLVDKVILNPTRHRIPVPGKSRILLSNEGDTLEVWIHPTGRRQERKPDLFVLKFPGTASRAEVSTDLPAGCWPYSSVEIWAVNPPGYGGSSGRASLQKIPAMARVALDGIHKAAAGRPVVVTGNSLGCVSALYLAAHRDVDGLLLRNPPPLREVMRGRPSRWHLKLATSLLARYIPEDLDTIRNAADSSVPAVFVTSCRDRVVPAEYQQRIFDAYAGPKRVLALPDADHATPLSDAEWEQLRRLAIWMRGLILQNRALPT